MEPELQMIGLDFGKLESKIDQQKIPTDEIELNPKINEQEITIGDLKNEIDEQDLKPLIIKLEQDLLIDEPHVQIDEPKLRTDELEPLCDEPEQNSKIDDTNLLIDESDLTIDEPKLKTDKSKLLYDEPKQNSKIDEQNLLEDSLTPRYQITIVNTKVTEMHLQTRTSWFKYFQQDLFVLCYFGFIIVCCGLNLYYLI
jgi:hypothetical protein